MMLRRLLLVRSIIGVAASLLLASAASGQQADWVPQQVIVRIQPDQEIGPINQMYGTTVKATIESAGLFLLQIPGGADERVLQARMAGDARLAWAELNFVQVAPEGSSQSFFLREANSGYYEQASAQVLDVGSSHKLTIGSGVIVAVVDTGIDATHPVLAGRIAAGGYNFIDNSSDVRDIGNGVDDNGNGQIDEMVGHGTFVSSLITLVAPGARVLPFKALNSDGVGSTFGVVQSMYAAVERGAHVINLSLGSIRPAQSLSDACSMAQSRGVVVVAAAGNRDASDPQVYPAAFPSVLGVICTNVGDRKSAFSDYGVWVSLAAPGEGVVGAMPGGGYAFASGCSFSGAFVSGGAALVRASRPGASPGLVRFYLESTARNINPLNPGYHGQLGSGRLDVGAAVATARSKFGTPIILGR